MNSEQITAFLQEHWYIASVLIGAVILFGAIRNWNWLCDPTGTRDAHRHSRGYRRVVFFLLGVLLICLLYTSRCVEETAAQHRRKGTGTHRVCCCQKYTAFGAGASETPGATPQY